MHARFRVRTRDGRELAANSLSDFASLVRAKQLGERDLIYDALTGEWATAMAHPVYRMVLDSVLKPRPKPTRKGSKKFRTAKGAAAAGAAGDDAAAMGLTLAPAPAGPSPEESAEAFIAQMDAERAADPDNPPALEDMKLVAGDASIGSNPVFSVSDEPEEVVQEGAAAPEPAAAPRAAPVTGAAPTPRTAPAPEAAAARAAAPAAEPALTLRPATAPPSPPARPARRDDAPPMSFPPPTLQAGQGRETPADPPTMRGLRRTWGFRRRSSSGASSAVRHLLWALGGIALLAAAVAAPAIWASDPVEDDSAVGARVIGAVETSPRLVAASIGGESDAQVRQVAAMRGVRDANGLWRELGAGSLPLIWLDGRYLADAANHPEIRAEWERYLAYVWAVRARSEESYRRAYLAELDRRGVVGPVRTMRLAAALQDFRALRTHREAELDRIEELAVAALSLHDLLVHLTGSITYEPVRGEELSADPVLEAAGADPASQQLLEEALQRVGEAMAADRGGPGSAERVPDWIRSVVEDALTLMPAG